MAWVSGAMTSVPMAFMVESTPSLRPWFIAAVSTFVGGAATEGYAMVRGWGERPGREMLGEVTGLGQ
jgi:hypothetical protein